MGQPGGVASIPDDAPVTIITRPPRAMTPELTVRRRAPEADFAVRPSRGRLSEDPVKEGSWLSIGDSRPGSVPRSGLPW